MKAKIKILAIIIALFSGCQKDKLENPKSLREQGNPVNLTLEEAKSFVSTMHQDSTKSLQRININWKSAISRGGTWTVPLAGQPIYQNYKQGYRELAITRDPRNNLIKARILEIIPDAIYLQRERQSNAKTFTGRVFEYNLNYKLVGGRLLSGGKPVGEIKQISERERIDNANKMLAESGSLNGLQGKLMKAMVMESCYWAQSSYVDAYGDFTVHAERICSYSIFDDGGGGGFYDGIGGGGTISETGGGGGSGTTTSPTAPPPSNLPGENNNKVDPKKMMECFSQITSPNAAFVVRVYVIEPQPGTSFNVGANSFGHVAISLSKTSGSTTITQTVGFYPTGTGLDKLSSKSQVLDNGFGEYNMSATYYVSGESFQKVIDFVSNPSSNYHFTDYNCSAFVYGAGQAGGIPIPDPTTQIGLGGPGGAGFAKTPAGMASALREQKSANPNLDINDAGGRMPESKGPCN